MSPPILARNLTKTFGSTRAVDDLSLTLERGQALGLLGPNGAGKSTALSMLMGLRAPTSGSVHIFGHAAGSAPARAAMGVTPQAAGFPDQLTPREVLHYARARQNAAATLDEVIHAFGLARLIDRRMTGFSGGEVRRVALALAFLGQPPLIFLDEPTAGLDPTAQEAFQQTARRYVDQGGALILTSHHWDEIEAVCDRITVIDQGRRVLDGSLATLQSHMQARQIRFALPDAIKPPAWLGAARQGTDWRAETDDSDACLRRLVADYIPFQDLTVQPLPLKDIIARIQVNPDTSTRRPANPKDTRP